MVIEDPQIRIKELERVLGVKLDLHFVEGLKDELDINQRACWYGGLGAEFYISPTGNYLTRPRAPYLGVEVELERLMAGLPPVEPAIDWRKYPIDTKRYPTL